MNKLLARPPIIAALLCFQNPRRHRLAIYIWNLIDYMDCDECPEGYWDILAFKYLRISYAKPETINGILSIAANQIRA